MTPPEQLAVHYELPEDVLALKHEAILAHEGQVEALVHVFGDRMREAVAVEAFRLAAERAP